MVLANQAAANCHHLSNGRDRGKASAALGLLRLQASGTTSIPRTNDGGTDVPLTGRVQSFAPGMG